MPNHLTVYLQSPIGEIKTENARKGISQADWWALAELIDIEEQQVDEFMNQLTWQDDPLQFSIPLNRPVQIHIITQTEAVQEAVDEINQNTLPKSVQALCPKIRSIVILELGFSQSNTMFEIVAFEIAYWLSKTYSGLIQSADGFWYDHNKNRWQPIK